MRTFSFALALLAATAAQAQTDVPSDASNPTYTLDDSHTLTAEGLGWKLTDKASGKEKNLLLPAFHPEQSHPVIEGNHLAYVSLTKHGDRQQLGCVTFDLAKGKVVNRRDSSLVAREGELLAAPTLNEGGEVNCHLKGDQCSTKGNNCIRAEEDVALNFVPGAVAGPPLKAKGRRGKLAKGARRGGKASHSAGRKAGKSSHGAPAHKAAPHAKSKSTAKKAKHQ